MKKMIKFPIIIAVVILASLGIRYEKVLTFIDAIEDANATVMGYLNIIKDARTAFTEAINNADLITADAESSTIDSIFVTLLAYVVY